MVNRDAWIEAPRGRLAGLLRGKPGTPGRAGVAHRLCVTAGRWGLRAAAALRAGEVGAQACPARGPSGGGGRGRSRGGLPPKRPIAGAPLGRPLRVSRSPGPPAPAPSALAVLRGAGPARCWPPWPPTPLPFAPGSPTAGRTPFSPVIPRASASSALTPQSTNTETASHAASTGSRPSGASPPETTAKPYPSTPSPLARQLWYGGDTWRLNLGPRRAT